MKKIFTILFILFGCIAYGQSVFYSNLSNWSGSGDPIDFMTTARTNIASSNVVEQTMLVTYGTSMASLINTSSTHKRFATGPITVVAGESYDIEMWLICAGSGEIRTGWYDVTNAAYNPSYNPYIDAATVSGGNLVKVTQTVTVPSNCIKAEFILSLKNTDASQAPMGIGIVIDSVAVTKVIATGLDNNAKKESFEQPYPNPAKNQIHFNINEQVARIKLYDLTGKKLKAINVSNLEAKSNIRVDLATLTSGIYFYELTDINGKTILTDKFVIVK